MSEQSYWATGRSRSRQDAAIDGSRNFGVYEVASNRQVAYARVITDGVTFAWLCDVFVDSEVRGIGIGRLLITGVVEQLEPLGLKRIALSTDDAHGLYSKVGFTALNLPETWMERRGDADVEHTLDVLWTSREDILHTATSESGPENRGDSPGSFRMSATVCRTVAASQASA